MEGESMCEKVGENCSQQKEERWHVGLSCSVNLPRDPFYIRPRLSPYLVSVVAAVEVPRYRHLSASRDLNSADDRKSGRNRVLCETSCSWKSDSSLIPVLDVW